LSREGIREGIEVRSDGDGYVFTIEIFGPIKNRRAILILVWNGGKDG